MDTYLLRIEGVNLDDFVFDTRNLSTVRGGSLLLLEIVSQIEDQLGRHTGVGSVSTVSRGASTGLFRIATDDPKGVVASIRTFLDSHPQVRHATIVLDAIRDEDPASDGFRLQDERLLAANRWRQMQDASLSIPPADLDTAPPGKPACALNGIRPAVNHSDYGAPNRTDKESFLCESAKQRHDYGRRERSRFYRRIVERGTARSETGRAGSDLPEFTREFESLATGMSDSHLEGKLAVFYADGNRFGKIQTAHCTTVEKQRAFDTYLRDRREDFLIRFLKEKILLDDRWRTLDEEGREVARFETLLWGGDEVMFVMPAGLGWEFAGFFFETLEDLNLRKAGKNDEFPGVPLTHAAALVFCHHHAPIDRLKRLAKDQMAETVKAADRETNGLLCEALESFDHLGQDYSGAIARRYRGALPLERKILRGAGEPLGGSLAKVGQFVEELRNSPTFPRSGLRKLVQGMILRPESAPQQATFGPSGEAPHELRNATPDEIHAIRTELMPLLGGDEVSLWIQLEELWD
ncbi:MAG: hypothetical protein KDA94_16740, partial [Acidimicrobiales bacterium]|nr:hypothetical protein [Acidimicrobiales bacterium]